MPKDKKLTIDDVKHLAVLANLKLTDGELAELLPQVGSFLDYVSKIKSLDTGSYEETSQVTGRENVFREDEVDTERMLTQEDALSNAKKTHEGFFVVPAIFGE